MQSDAKAPRAKVVPIKADNAIERAKLARLPAPVHSVQEKGKQQFSKALRTLFDNADDALFVLADKASSNHEQNLYFESMREVRIRRRELESTFSGAIDKAFVDLVIKDRALRSDAYALGDGLSLVEDDELEELVAVDSMVAKANKICGEALQFLSLRLDSLVPNKVYQKTNPLGPDIVCNAFVDAARELNADIKAKLVLLKLFDQYVVGQLPQIYESLNATLIEHNVLPSLQHSKPDAQNPPAGKPDTQSAPTAMVNAAGEAGAVFMSGDDLLFALTQIQGSLPSKQSEATGSPAAAVQTDVGGLLLRVLEEQREQRTLNQSQIETIDLVKHLFEFILDDRNLAQPMKMLIGRLQIPILKVALLDDSFFTRRGHPARRLLNEMATASLGWQENPRDEGLPRDPLYRQINGIVQQLLSDFDTELSLFNGVLADFMSFIEKERKRASILEQRTIDAEDGKAKAETARRKVDAALGRVTDGKSVPAPVRQIVEDAWSNVLFLICLKQGAGSEEWQQALQTAEDLIWSVTVDRTPAARQQLLGMIPQLIKRLREGLERIAYNPFEMTQLLNSLEKLHLARLQPEVTDAEPSVTDKRAEEQAEESTGGLGETLEAAELDAERSVPEDDASANAVSSESRYLTLVGKLTQGTWFEMTDDSGNRYRCRLAAIIKPTGKYIFVNRSGMKVAEKTKEGLAIAMKENKLKLLDDTMLFDRALESVIGGLRKPRA